MYLRETRRRNKDGSEVAYLALAHNERDRATGMPKAHVVHNFGRADQVDRDALARLVKSISRFLDPADAAVAAASGEVRVLDSRPMGTAWVADQLWRRLGICAEILTACRARTGPGRRVDPAVVERVIFSMVANRLSPMWAYMAMATLAWSLKAWCALLLPVSPRWAERHNEQRRRLLTMEFRTFVAAFINIPAQIIKTGRRVRWRILAYNPWLGPFFRLVDTL